jgi:putative transposase
VPSYQKHPRAFDSRLPLAPFVDDPHLPLGGLFTADDLQQTFDRYQLTFGRTTKAVFTPAILLWTSLWQSLSRARSCGAAVIRTTVLLVALKLPSWSEDTGVYCRALAKLPKALVRELALTIGQRVEDAAAAAWLYHGRHVHLLDGSTATLADTPQNQRAYPQSNSQAAGLGFPIIRFVVLLALATATIEGLAYGPYQGKETGETALARQLFERLRAGDIVVADRYYCSYWLVALLLALGVQVVFRMHQLRQYDFSQGRRLGHHDQVVKWLRPQRPEWMTAEEYARIPEEIEVRELQVQVLGKGYRTRSLVLVTTLLDEVEFPKDDIGDLYHMRWHAELDLRALKQTLGMDQLRSTAPELVERELWMRVLSYNLVRKVMAQAALWAQAQGRKRRRRPGQAEAATNWTPRQFSFSCAVEQVMSWWHENTTGAAENQTARYEALLAGVSRRRVGQRPGRCEPRAVKRRPKEYDRLMEPRAVAQARLRGELPPRESKDQATSASKRGKPKPGAATRPKGKTAGARGRTGGKR